MRISEHQASADGFSAAAFETLPLELKTRGTSITDRVGGLEPAKNRDDTILYDAGNPTNSLAYLAGGQAA